VMHGFSSLPFCWQYPLYFFSISFPPPSSSSSLYTFHIPHTLQHSLTFPLPIKSNRIISCSLSGYVSAYLDPALGSCIMVSVCKQSLASNTVIVGTWIILSVMYPLNIWEVE
jgi:hypothetical protein